MATPQDWYYLRDQFQRLAQDPDSAQIEANLGPALREDLNGAAPDAWRLVGSPPDYDNDEFLSLADHGAALLGHSEASPHRWMKWLDTLAVSGDRLEYEFELDSTGAYKTSSIAEIRAMTEQELGTWKDTYGVRTIRNVCRASAEHCLRLAIQVNGTMAQRRPSEKRLFPNRAAWLQAEMKRQGNITRHRAADLSTVDKKTIKKILDGQPVRDDVLDKLADWLSIEVRSIPST